MAGEKRFARSGPGRPPLIAMLLAGLATAVVPAMPVMAQSPMPAAAPAPVAAPATDELLSQAQLEQILAPIALYPDELLMQVLMAATYPREVAEAARWSLQALEAPNGFAAALAVKGKLGRLRVFRMRSDFGFQDESFETNLQQEQLSG